MSIVRTRYTFVWTVADKKSEQKCVQFPFIFAAGGDGGDGGDGGGAGGAGGQGGDGGNGEEEERQAEGHGETGGKRKYPLLIGFV